MSSKGIDFGHAGPLREADPARNCKRFSGRAALLTAAARGIGLACALRLAAEGATVCVTDRDEDALAEAAALAQQAGLTLHTSVMDSSDVLDTATRIETLQQLLGPFDILVNNAGGSLHTPYHFMDETDAHWQSVIELNMMSAVWSCRAVLPGMVARGVGRIVNFGSKAGRFASLIAGANYAAVKGAMASLTRQLALEYGAYGITVNCICPGIVMTARTRSLWSERRTPAERARVLDEIPLKRHCEVEDVAASVAFLASDDAAFITGATLDLNGGQAMA
ncbi:SDR family oxidoreductase [Verminephrobacter eiseniae]|uniref:SDR family NAD(P)-dependent oxidoreductase n=1 Tax=Verminephrobacter eiseniae TaxID=364317 RepID=UPI0022371073|nr:SDR family NAD(P)-dependent oxidoreductase [Verminephrobacter eiseniae]MCW5260441.1 SDR family oxidoreductase [Verminephrobacter eiseniae]